MYDGIEKLMKYAKGVSAKTHGFDSEGNDVDINYKNVELLLNFITERKKIAPRRMTGNSASQQRLISKEIKKARYMALIPYTVNHK